MKLRKFILIRHGQYDGENGQPNEKMNIIGRMQMQRLATLVGGLINKDDKIKLLYSPAKRVVECTDVFVETLSNFGFSIATAEEKPELYCYQFQPALQEITDLIGAEDEVVVMITHLEVMEQLPSFINKSLLGNRIPLPSGLTMGSGGAFIIDCQENTFNPIFP